MISVRYRLQEGITVCFDQARIPTRQPIEFKPVGLWFTPTPNDWKDWCQENEYGDAHLMQTIAFKMNIADVLLISDKEELKDFYESYKDTTRYQCEMIDWQRVAQHYSGIEIVPYLWECRYDVGLWYYAWDVASGCIWRDVIDELREST